jgi:hypothetical protein
MLEKLKQMSLLELIRFHFEARDRCWVQEENVSRKEMLRRAQEGDSRP